MADDELGLPDISQLSGYNLYPPRAEDSPRKGEKEEPTEDFFDAELEELLSDADEEESYTSPQAPPPEPADTPRAVTDFDAELESLLADDEDDGEEAYTPPPPSTREEASAPAASDFEAELEALLADDDDDFLPPQNTSPINDTEEELTDFDSLLASTAEEPAEDGSLDSAYDDYVEAARTAKNEAPASYSDDSDDDYEEEIDWDALGVDPDDEEDEYSPSDDGGNHFYYQSSPMEDPALDSPSEEEHSPFEEDYEEDEDIIEDDAPSNSFKEKFAAFKAQVKAELQGKDAPEEETSKELALRDKDDEVAEREKKPKKKKAKGKAFGPFLWLKKLYLSIVDFVFSVIEGTLKFLSKLPLIGPLFKYLLKFTKIIKIIANSVPAVLIIVLLVLLNKFFVPGEAEAELPDQGAVTFSEFSWDGDRQTARGVITNNGEAMAEVIPTFSVYSTNPLNPLSWVKPSHQADCEGVPVVVSIDDTLQVDVSCTDVSGGLFTRVTGELRSSEYNPRPEE